MKEVYIHVGPPKTGTSAIQKFLATNPDILSKLGISYPQHAVDKNGISSGNYTAIYSSTQRKVVDPEKVESLLKGFYKSEKSILLLSSEGFFDRMNEISEAIPGAKMIFYMRSPLDYMESTYNQSVKRQINTEPFTINTLKPDLSKVKVLNSYIQTNGIKNLRLRYYQPTCFKGGDIVSDFFSVMGITDFRKAKNERINASYSFEALEFKRHINKLKPSAYCQYLLDKILQNHIGIMDYSLLSPEKYKELRQKEIEELTSFFIQNKLKGFETYITALANENQKTYKEQYLSPEQWNKMVFFVCKASPELYVHLIDLMKSNQDKLPQEAQTMWKNTLLSKALLPLYRATFNGRQFLNKLYRKLS